MVHSVCKHEDHKLIKNCQGLKIFCQDLLINTHTQQENNEQNLHELE